MILRTQAEFECAVTEILDLLHDGALDAPRLQVLNDAVVQYYRRLHVHTSPQPQNAQQKPEGEEA